MCNASETCFLLSRSYESSGGTTSPNSLSSWIPSFSFCGKIIIRSLFCMSTTMQRCWTFGGLLWTGCLVVTVSTGLWWGMFGRRASFWFTFGKTKHFLYLQLQGLFWPILSCFAELQLLQVVKDMKLHTEPLEKACLCSLKDLCDSVTFISCSRPGLTPVNLAFSLCGGCRPSDETMLFSKWGPDTCFSCKMANSDSCPWICQVHLRCYFIILISLYHKP